MFKNSKDSISMSIHRKSFLTYNIIISQEKSDDVEETISTHLGNDSSDDLSRAAGLPPSRVYKPNDKSSTEEHVQTIQTPESSIENNASDTEAENDEYQDKKDPLTASADPEMDESGSVVVVGLAAVDWAYGTVISADRSCEFEIYGCGDDDGIQRE